MGQQFAQLSDDLIQFVLAQKLFFVGTAAAESRVNVSPKGMDSLRVLSPTRVVWLNLTGSANETSAHVQQNPRMTIMFCSFAERPLILRLYGQARVIHRVDPEWDALLSLFPPQPGARQIFDLAIDLVQSSCGHAVPFFSYVGERDTLTQWALKKGEAGLREYRQKNNQTSLDGMPTNIIAKGG